MFNQIRDNKSFRLQKYVLMTGLNYVVIKYIVISITKNTRLYYVDFPPLDNFKIVHYLHCIYSIMICYSVFTIYVKS